MTASDLSTALLHLLLGGFLGAVLGWALHHARTEETPDPKPALPVTAPHLVLLSEEAPAPASREWSQPRLRLVA